MKPIYAALDEFLTQGVRYAFPAEEGAMTRGMPTASAARARIVLDRIDAICRLAERA